MSPNSRTFNSCYSDRLRNRVNSTRVVCAWSSIAPIIAQHNLISGARTIVVDGVVHQEKKVISPTCTHGGCDVEHDVSLYSMSQLSFNLVGEMKFEMLGKHFLLESTFKWPVSPSSAFIFTRVCVYVCVRSQDFSFHRWDSAFVSICVYVYGFMTMCMVSWLPSQFNCRQFLFSTHRSIRIQFVCRRQAGPDVGKARAYQALILFVAIFCQ